MDDAICADEFHAIPCACRAGGEPTFAPVVITNRESAFLNRIGVPVAVHAGDHGTTLMIAFAQGPAAMPLPFGIGEIERYEAR